MARRADVVSVRVSTKEVGCASALVTVDGGRNSVFLHREDVAISLGGVDNGIG